MRTPLLWLVRSKRFFPDQLRAKTTPATSSIRQRNARQGSRHFNLPIHDEGMWKEADFMKVLARLKDKFHGQLLRARTSVGESSTTAVKWRTNQRRQGWPSNVCSGT